MRGINNLQRLTLSFAVAYHPMRLQSRVVDQRRLLTMALV